ICNHPASAEISTLSLHDALPISKRSVQPRGGGSEGSSGSDADAATSRKPRRPASDGTGRAGAEGSTIRAVETEIATESSGGHCRSEEHTSELQSRRDLVCRLLLE